MSDRLGYLLNNLESAAEKIDQNLPLDVEDADALQSIREALQLDPSSKPEAPPAIQRPPEAKIWRRRWIPLTAAAAIVGGFLLHTLVVSTSPSKRPYGIHLTADHILQPLRSPEESRIDNFHLQASERCCVLVLFRSWDSEKNSLAWKPFLWDEQDENARTYLEPGKKIKIPMNVTGDPPVEQYLILAASRHQEDLPGTEQDLKPILRRLQQTYEQTKAEESLYSAIVSVNACLPDRVSVVGRPFVVQP